jgi:hypothetical protein
MRLYCSSDSSALRGSSSSFSHVIFKKGGTYISKRPSP